MTSNYRNSFILFSLICLTACSTKPIPGPDKQAVGTLFGAAWGAGSGAITGAQLGAGMGPGAWVGAALGSVYGMFRGFGVDLMEEEQIRQAIDLDEMQRTAWAQSVLAEHYARRLELYPSRDIFPADLFFCDDSANLNEESKALAYQLGVQSKERMPWSRLAVTSYVTAEVDSPYAAELAKKRAEEIALQFVKAGVNPRRVLAKWAVIKEPLVRDSLDKPGRYYQAVEIVPLDR